LEGTDNFRNIQKICKLDKKMLRKTLYRVRYLQGSFDPFEVKSGLKQGNVLSFALFKLILEKIIRNTNDDRRMEMNNEQVILAYADDIVVVSETKEEVINATSKLINASRGIGLHVNEGKTKFMVVSRSPQNIDLQPCETWSMTKSDSRRLIIFERKLLRTIYGSIFNMEIQTYEREAMKIQRYYIIGQTYSPLSGENG